MTPKVQFLAGSGFNVIDEVVELMDPRNPIVACRDLPAFITTLAEKMPEVSAGRPFREFRGSSGAIFPVYLTDSEPYVAYAVIKREAELEILVLKVGLRDDQKSATFFREVGNEIERRVASKGWSL